MTSPLHHNVNLGYRTMFKRPLTNQDSLIIFFGGVHFALTYVPTNLINIPTIA